MNGNDVLLISYDNRKRYYVDAYLMNHPDYNSLELGMELPYKRIVAIVESSRLQLYKALFKTVWFISDQCDDLKMEIENSLDGRLVSNIDDNFTNSEKRLLDILCYGVSTKEICKELGMSDRSVRRLKNRLYEKTGLKSSQQLSIYALMIQRRSKIQPIT